MKKAKWPMTEEVADRRIRAAQRRRCRVDAREPYALERSGWHAIQAGEPYPLDAFLAEEAAFAELEAEANEPASCNRDHLWQQSDYGHEHVVQRGPWFGYWTDSEDWDLQ